MNDELLRELREKIDRLDAGIVRLLNERAAVSIEIGRIKCEAGCDICDPSREERIYRNLVAKTTAGFCPRAPCGRSSGRSSPPPVRFRSR